MLKWTIVLPSALILVAALGFTAPSANPADDLAAIKQNTTDFKAAWNKHDAKAIAALWAADGDLIDPWGRTSVGRESVAKFFAGEHTGTGGLAKCTFDIKKDSPRLITPDVCVEDWEVVLTGLASKDGKPMDPQFHRVVIVSKKEGGKWLFAAARPGIPTPVTEMPITPAVKTGK